MKILIKISKFLEVFCKTETIYFIFIFILFKSFLEAIVLQIFFIENEYFLITLLGVVIFSSFSIFIKSKLKVSIIKSLTEFIIKAKVKKHINNNQVFNYLIKETYCYDYRKYEKCKTTMDYVSTFYDEGILSISNKNLIESLWRKHFFKNYSFKEKFQNEYEKENELYSVYKRGVIDLNLLCNLPSSFNLNLDYDFKKWQEMIEFQKSTNKILNYNTEYRLEFRNIANLYILAIKEYKEEEKLIGVSNAYKKEINICYDSLLKKINKLDNEIEIEISNQINDEHNKKLKKIEDSKNQSIFNRRNAFDSYIKMD